MELENLLEASNTTDLERALSSLASHHWNADACYFFHYDSESQLISRGERTWELSSEYQMGAAALSLRTTKDQEAGWPEELAVKESDFRLCVPVFCWGSLSGLLALAFSEEPKSLKGLPNLTKYLGLIGDKIAQVERSQHFINRCKELLVQAVEAHGQNGHVERCSRLTQALSTMLDCSPQVQSELMDAVQYHDIGLLTFADTRSVEAEREHPLIGAGLLKGHPELHQVAQIVESHHERYDGSGQPNAKQGDDLPMECWILALVEHFVETWESSMTSPETKVKEFFEGHAKHHHPDVVDALCGLIDAGRLSELMD